MRDIIEMYHKEKEAIIRNEYNNFNKNENKIRIVIESSTLRL